MHDQTTAIRSPSPGTRVSAFVLALGLLWVVLIVGGMFLLIQYAGASGVPALAPVTWPPESRLPRDDARPTLLMFVHPRCPCSSASIGELERLMARCQGQISASVLFIHPSGMDAAWRTTDLWKQAVAIPGVTVQSDEAGFEAGLFNAQTSGQALFYERDGTLKFQGGITISRGHHGDNPGSDALMALLSHKLSTPVSTPVFGCSLSANERAPTKVP